MKKVKSIELPSMVTLGLQGQYIDVQFDTTMTIDILE